MGEKVSKKKRERREAEAKAKEQKSTRNYFLGMTLVMCLLIWGVGYLFNGTTVGTLPREKAVEQIVISDSRYSDEAKVIRDEKQLKDACAVLGMLRVKFGEAEMTEEPLITVFYQMTDGTEKELLLGETTMRWDGKDYNLKDRTYKMFLDMEQAYFFPETVTAENETLTK